MTPRLLRPLGAALLVFFALAVAEAAAAPAPHHLRSAVTEGFWTPERIGRADPLPVPTIPAPLAGGGTIVRPGPDPPFTSGPVADLDRTRFPYRANGILVGKFPKLGLYSCSATVVRSGSDSTILTAGHCLYDQRVGYAKAVAFAPAYDRGDTPFGVYSGKVGGASRQWVRKGNPHYDYAAIRLRAANRGKVGRVVGEVPIAVDRPRNQTFTAAGYPANLGDGQVMWRCDSQYAGADGKGRFSGRPDSGIGCNMGSGSSGGSWMIRDAADRPFVNSVTSYKYGGLRNVLFGPYFTPKVLRLVGAVSRG